MPAEPYTPTLSLPPDFSDHLHRLEDEEEENERTPLLAEGSVVSVVTDPGNRFDYPSTSRSTDGRRHLRTDRTETDGAIRIRRSRRPRRVNSESDVRKLKRQV